jgi:hypothetical protein
MSHMNENAVTASSPSLVEAYTIIHHTFWPLTPPFCALWAHSLFLKAGFDLRANHRLWPFGILGP